MTEECVSIHRLDTAKILQSALTGFPRQGGKVGLTINIHCETRGHTGHCEDREKINIVTDSSRKQFKKIFF